MKRSQNLRILDWLDRYGYITIRDAQVHMDIRNPYARLKELRERLDKLNDFRAKTKWGDIIKIYYLRKRAALDYARIHGMEVL